MVLTCVSNWSGLPPSSEDEDVVHPATSQPRAVEVDDADVGWFTSSQSSASQLPRDAPRRGRPNLNYLEALSHASSARPAAASPPTPLPEPMNQALQLQPVCEVTESTMVLDLPTAEVRVGLVAGPGGWFSETWLQSASGRVRNHQLSVGQSEADNEASASAVMDSCFNLKAPMLVFLGARNQALGIERHKLAQAVTRCASSALASARHARRKLETALALGCSRRNLILYADGSRYDETPMAVGRKDLSTLPPAVASEAVETDGGEGLQLVLSQPSTTCKAAVLGRSSTSCKLLQMESTFGALIRRPVGAGAEFAMFAGESVNFLQTFDRAKGATTQEAVRRTSCISPVAQWLGKKMRLTTTDAFSANTCAERSIAAQRGWDLLHVRCDIRRGSDEGVASHRTYSSGACPLGTQFVVRGSNE